MILIVPNTLRDAINARLDEALLDHPDAVIDRDSYFHTLLEYFDEHGEIPEFSLVRKFERGTA